MKRDDIKSASEETKFFDMKETVELNSPEISEDTAEYEINNQLDDENDFEEYDYYEEYSDEEYKPKKKKFIIAGVIIGALIIGIISVVYLISKTEYIDEIIVYVDGVEVETLSKVEDGTLEKRLDEAGYTNDLYKTDTAKKKSDTKIYLLQKKSIEVTYASKKWNRSPQIVYQYTLDQVLNELKIDLSDNSTVYLNNTKVDSGNLKEVPVNDKDYIKIVENKTTTEVVEEVIPFTTITKYDDTLLEGQTKVEIAGQNGLKKITYEVKFVDGVEVSRKVVKEELVKEPVNEVKVVGTKKPVVNPVPITPTPPPTTPTNPNNSNGAR